MPGRPEPQVRHPASCNACDDPAVYLDPRRVGWLCKGCWLEITKGEIPPYLQSFIGEAEDPVELTDTRYHGDTWSGR